MDLKSEHFPYHEGLGVCAAFRRAIAFAPDAPALLSNSECLSYRSFDARVAAVARLLQTNGVGAGGFVGIYAQRSVEAIVAQLAVLRIGAAFVPMDPDFAPEQLVYIAQDIALDAILAHADHIGAAQQIATGGTPVLKITRDEVFDDVAADAAEVADLDPACVLYTSGTTGRPKGVIIPQRALASMALVQPEIAMYPGDRALCAKTVASDGALYDIYTALLNGAALAICEVHPPTVAALAQTVEDFDVTVLSLYASLLNLLIANRIDVFMNLRLVLSGGDAVSVPHARKLLDTYPDIDFVNVYGPTETCAQSLCRVITQADLEGGSIPIGRVFPLEDILLLDEELQPVAEGQVGQIAIAGIGVALGYHGRPDLTAEKFIPDPRAAFGGNVYLTGDLGRDVGGGIYTFHGRSDRQVKLAGRRVEIDGIESALASLAEVDEVAVVFVPDPSPHLVAFVVPTPLGATVQNLTATLREKTRDMIAADIFPRRVEVMQFLPLTAVAKVDHKALLAMIATNADRTSRAVESIPHSVRDLADRPFRRLLDDLDTITEVAAHIDGVLPAETVPSEAPAMPITPPAGETLPSFAQLAQEMSQSAARAGASGSMLAVIQAQLDAMQALFAQQLAAIGAHVTNAGSITAQNMPGFTPFAPGTETAVRAGAITDAALQSAPPNCGTVPLTRSQREIWMARQFGDAAECAFIESVSIHLRGALDVQAIEQAWRDLLSRHDALRTRFARDGATFTTVEGSGDAAILGRRDFSDTQDPQAAFDAFLAENATTPFDLIEESAVRGTLIAMGGDRHVLVISADHIVVDGWSFDVLGAELAELYTAAKECRSADLGDAPSYAAYAATQAGRTDPEVLAYWRETFKIIPERVELPSRQNRPAQRGFDGGTVFHNIPAELLAGVQRVGAANGCTVFQTLFGAMLILVQRLSGAEDLVVGVPTADQMNLPETNAVGHHVNFLPVRALVSADLELKEVLQIGRGAMNAALGHGRITYGALLEELDIPRSVNRLPLTGIEFNFDAGGADLSMPDLEVDMVSNPKQAVAFELFLNVAQHERGLRIEANYNSGFFDAELVTAWAQTYEKILEAFVQSDTTKVEALQLGQSMLPGAAAPFVALPEKFAQIAADNADRIAVEAGDVQWSYGMLQARAGEIAAYLQKTQPVAGGRIAVCLDRSCGLVAALLGILQAGFSYVPLDPRQPAVRLGQICKEAGVQAVICDKAGAAALPDVPAILLDDVPQGAAPQPVEINAQDTAYTIFTSGSTGTPKGVVVPHGALANFLRSMGETPGIGSDDTLLAVTTAMFDIAALELFLPLLNGARVIVASPQEQVDGFALAQMVNDGAITILQATPTLWDMLLVAGLRPRADLRMLCGGEPMPRDLATRLCRDGAELWNMYGPTETTIWSAVKRVDPDGPITIGDPIMATALLILDPNDMPVLPGMTGELNIAGTGLAEGYLNRPDLTEAAFREIDVEGMTLRAYRTGDQARFLANGEIEVLGRLDGQIKLRGFRIELGEIETALRGHADVAQAAVALRQHDNNDPFLAAFVVLEEGAVFDAAGISSHVAGLLPDYMVPNRVMPVDTLPRTVGGKLDRKALPEMVGSVVASTDPVAPSKPRTDTEKMICAIWTDVLGRNDFGPDDQIYTLGIDSLKLFRIAARMLAEGLELEVKHIFAHPSVSELAAFYDKRRKSASTPGDGTSENKRLSLSAYRHGAGRGNRHVT